MSQQSKPNAVRRAKMRTLTLSDEAWAELERRAGPGGSKSKIVETWLRGEPVALWREREGKKRTGHS